MDRSGDTPLGVIAGKGRLPQMLVRAARAAGRRVVAVVFDEESATGFTGIADEVHVVALAQAGKTIAHLKNAGAVEVVFIGKVDKRVLFDNPRFDLKALSILKNVSLKNDDALMGAIVATLEEEGFVVVPQDALLKEFMPPTGVYSARRLTEAEEADVAYGLRMAKGVAALDIGQTVVVKETAVVAVEAIDGTDETIARGGAIAGAGAVVCKVAKPKQDNRFDIPTVGVATVEAAAAAGVAVIAFEADATFVVDIDAVTAACDAAGIALVGAPVGKEPA